MTVALVSKNTTGPTSDNTRGQAGFLFGSINRSSRSAVLVRRWRNVVVRLAAWAIRRGAAVVRHALRHATHRRPAVAGRVPVVVADSAGVPIEPAAVVAIPAAILPVVLVQTGVAVRFLFLTILLVLELLAVLLEVLRIGIAFVKVLRPHVVLGNQVGLEAVLVHLGQRDLLRSIVHRFVALVGLVGLDVLVGLDGFVGLVDLVGGS